MYDVQSQYRRTRSIQVFTFLLLYDILMITFNSHYIPVKVILKQAAVSVPIIPTYLLQVISISVSHTHLLLFFGPTILPSSL